MIKRLCLTLSLLLLPVFGWSQITGFVDTFSDGSLDTLWNGESHTLWSTDYPDTYSLSEANGVLSVAYTRSGSSGDGDNFRFTPPEEVDISDNPRISLRVKSSVNTTLTLHAAFLPFFGFQEYFDVSIPGDNEWRNYVFQVDPASFGSNDLQYAGIYFDRNTSSNRIGTVQIDDFKVSGFIIEVNDLAAEVVNGNDVQLNWTSTDPDATNIYKIYRANEPGFDSSNETLVTATTNNSFLDQGLDPYTHYYYKVIPIDTLGEEYYPSNEVHVETFMEGEYPEVSVLSVNTEEPGKYEEFALELDLSNVGIENPYDPTDIDVHAWFKSPEGDTTWINGFYDNYTNADTWRIYFSTAITGSWEYKVFVKDIGGTGESATGTFTVQDNDHKGPLTISEVNPDYFKYHNGAPFYGLAVYYPWYIEEPGLDRLKSFGLNMVAYWNGTYDGNGNGGGRYLFESIDSGLGRYDQRKMGRLEQILGWLEERDMMLMYAIWAHPFLRDGAPGWDPIDWPGHNPYQDIVTARDFYTDSLAWEYQKKQYRYLIARFAHHRSLGIWEILNEMHGTTGFYYDENGALAWADKVHDYLKKNDPYQRPTTFSFGSVEGWSQKDIKSDIANRHYYEAQGYPRPTGNAVEDGLINVTEVYEGLKRSGSRPAMLGEAGAGSMFSTIASDGYTYEFHNAYWAGLSTGMASTPFWWDYTTLSIFTDQRMETYSNLAKFEKDLNLSNSVYERSSFEADGANIYLNQQDTAAFAWLWKSSSEQIQGTDFSVKDLTTGSYEVYWYDTWNGEYVTTDTLVSIDGKLPLTVHSESIVHRDVAMRLNQIENGSVGSMLKLCIREDNVEQIPDSSYTIYAYATDASGRLIDSYDGGITFTLSGNGSLSSTTANAVNGIASVLFTPDENGDQFSITAEAAGLESASLNDVMVTGNETEPIPGFPSTIDLHQNFPNPFNPSTRIRFDLPQTSKVKLEVFDITGRLVRTIVNGIRPQGSHIETFQADHLASGVYIYRLEAGSEVKTQRMLLIK
jgi:hypothetical protein